MRRVRMFLIVLAFPLPTVVGHAQDIDQLQAIMDKTPAKCGSYTHHVYLDYHQCDSYIDQRLGASCVDEVARKTRIIWKWNSFVRNCRSLETSTERTQMLPRGNNAAVTEPDSEEVTALIQRARKLAEARDIAAARLVLRRAAEAHSAQAALALGGMYDPNVLKSLGVQGVESDIAEARRWYERAKEYGSEEAPRRLEALVGPRP
jgi:hypothetical protein